jgi:hypothetical protein
MNSEIFFVIEVCAASQDHWLQGLKPLKYSGAYGGPKSRPSRNCRCHVVSRAVPFGVAVSDDELQAICVEARGNSGT